MTLGDDNAAGPPGQADASEVLQVERRDFTDLVPVSRGRVQPMEGFDPIYTDIVDYIVRCTHRIWDERDVGLIYTHYTHNCVVYGPLGTVYDREAVVQETIRRIALLPERRGMATHVIWRGDDVEGFYTSHLVTGSGRHSQPGRYGPPTGRTFASRTVADCMIHANRIYREWVVADQMAILLQLGVDPDGYAEALAAALHARGVAQLDMGETRRMVGQYPPEAEPDLSLARSDLERWALTWLNDVWNRRLFGRIAEVCAPHVTFHGPLMSEVCGVAGILHHTIGLLACFPDAAFVPQHICSTPCDEGGTKVAVRWILSGHHLGDGVLRRLGTPTGKAVHLMGMSHFHSRDGRIVEEWRVFDELSILLQIRLAEMAGAEAGARTHARVHDGAEAADADA